MRAFLSTIAVLAVSVFAVPLPKADRQFNRFSGFQHKKDSFKKFGAFPGSSGSFVRSNTAVAKGTVQYGSAKKLAQVVGGSAPPPPTDCGYTEQTIIAPLLSRKDMVQLGTLTAVIQSSTVELSYKLERQDCILINKLNVNIVDKPRHSGHPSEFPCSVTGNQDVIQNFTCPLNLFDSKCCGTKTAYVEGMVLCAGEVVTIYAGQPVCDGSDGWCDTMTIEPPCACGCDDATDKCVDTSVTCPECGGEVCDDSECSVFINCEDTHTDCGGQVCDMNECRKKIVDNACPSAEIIPGKFRQIRLKTDEILETTNREAGSYFCAEDCCPIGETVTLDLSFIGELESPLGGLPDYFLPSFNDEDAVAFCCPFCEIYNDGACYPGEGQCDPCTIGARKACKQVGDDYKWYVAPHIIMFH